MAAVVLQPRAPRLGNRVAAVRPSRVVRPKRARRAADVSGKLTNGRLVSRLASLCFCRVPVLRFLGTPRGVARQRTWALRDVGRALMRVSCLALGPQIIANHHMQSISFASGGDPVSAPSCSALLWPGVFGKGPSFQGRLLGHDRER